MLQSPKEIKELIKLNKKEIESLKKEIVNLEIMLESNKVIEKVQPGDDVYIFSDNLTKKEKFTQYIKEKYTTKDIVKYIYVLESNRGTDKYNMYEIFNDEIDEIETIMSEEVKHKKDWEFNIMTFGKNIHSEQFLKYLVKEIGGKKMYTDKLVYHHSGFSYNTLHRVELPIIHIVGDLDKEKNDNDDNDIVIDVLSFVDNKKYYEIESGVCRG